jgi:hypothetical protein
MTKVKAYIVHDGDECWSIQYAERAVTARRRGANELNCDFGDVESFYRVPELDQYDGLPIPIEVMLNLNWWTECTGCGRKIDQSLIDNPEDDWDYDLQALRPKLAPVGEWGRCWCTPACRDDYLETQLWRKSAKELALSGLTDVVRGLVPEAVVRNTYAYVDDHCRLKEAHVDFLFPGALHGGASAIRRNGETHWYVSNGDLDAWERYHGTAWAVPHLPRIVRMFER